MTTRRDDTEATILADAEALRQVTTAGLRTPAQTARALARHDQRGGAFVTTKTSKRWIKMAAAAAVLLAAGVVVAATQGALFSIWVDTDGKTDEQVETEIRGQLVNDGVTDPEVTYERDGDEDRLEIEGEKGDRQFHVVRRRVGAGGGVIELSPPELDTAREPGMTDEQLEAKIEAQLQALGLGGEVTVDGDRVEIRAEKEHCEGEGCD